MPVSLDEVVTGLGLLGNVLSMPRQVQNQQIQNEQTRALLKDSGLPPEMIASATPEPMMRWLSPQQGGFTGHLLGGVGDVGSILSTVVGKPVKAPRVDLADLASASKLRSAHAEALAKDRLGKVIMDPTSTPRDIAAASIAAGGTDQALRLLRPGGGEPWRGTPGERVTLTEEAQRDYRRNAAANMTFRDERERQNFVEGGIMPPQEPATPHYDPAQTYRMRHDEEQKQRDKDAQAAGYKPGSPEHKYWLAFGHPPIARQPKAEPTYEEDYAAEQRRRDLLAKDARTARTIPDEPIDVTVRRNRAARAAGKGAETSGADIPPPPPPRAKRGAAGGAAVGAVLGGSPTETPTTTPESTTTSTTQPPDVADSDAQALAVLRTIDFDSLPPDVQKQVNDAKAGGMALWPLANWLVSLQPPKPSPGP